MANEMKIYEKYFTVSREEGNNKVISASEAISRYVRPGMSIHFGFTHYRAHGAAYEIARQFWGKNPQFTLIATGILEYGIIFIFGGLIRKAIASFYGDTYPTPSPNPILQKAFTEHQVELENWTNLTIPLRFLAAAYNLPYIPTNSIYGSTMEEENHHAFYNFENLGPADRKFQLLSPLRPDLTIIHGWAADPNGNTILLPPYGENAWGAYASKEGVLVTVERVVSTEYIREYSHLVKIPAHLVKSVSVVPFGAHPQGMSNMGNPELEAYAEDYQFRLDFRTASKNRKEFQNWVDYWVLDCQSHDDYLKKIGYSRLMSLKGKGNKDSWMYDIRLKSDDISVSNEYTASELMVVMTSRILQEKITKNKYRNLLAGIGTSSLAASLANYLLKNRGYENIDLLAETGFYGYAPRPGDPFLFNLANIPTNKMQSNFVDILNFFVGGNNNHCIGVLASAQVDKYGNLNSTRLEDGQYLTGSGGANDVTSGAEEVIVVLKQSTRRFVEKLPYITCKGNKITTLISDLGIFEKKESDGEFVLTHCLPNNEFSTLASKMRNVQEKCGWPLRTADHIKEMQPPEIDELQIIRYLDPGGFYR